MGLGFLCKYTALCQIVCWAIFFALWQPARAHLRQPGPWLALLIFLICTLPVIIWNAQHGWITVHARRGQRRHCTAQWHPTLRYFWDFLFSEAGLLNPVFFVGALWAMFGFWKLRRETSAVALFFLHGRAGFPRLLALFVSLAHFAELDCARRRCRCFA